MKEYHKPEIELNQFDMADVLDLSVDTQFNGDWFGDGSNGGDFSA